MTEFEMDYNAEDAAELVTMIRVSKCQKNEEGFAKLLGTTVDKIRRAEKGQGVAYQEIINKMMKLKLIKVRLIVEV